MAKALKRADSVELVAAAEIATLKSFRLPGSAGGTDADQLIEGIRSALPSNGGRLDVAVRVAPTDDNGSMLNFGFLPRSRLKSWFEAIQKYGVEGRFGGIDSETGLIAAVSPDGGAQLPARIGPEAPTPRGGVTVALVAGLIACTVLLRFALYQHREGYVAELSTKADAVGQDEAALIALEGEVTGLRQARVLLVASADIGPAGDVLDHMVALIPKTATLSRFVTDGHHVTLSGETRDRAALLKALSDDPAISGVTPVEPAEGESFIVELGIALVPDIAPASEIEGMP